MTEEKTMKTNSTISVCRTIILAGLLAALACLPAILLGATPQAIGQTTVGQKGFSSPKDAAKALVKAAEAYDLPALLEIVGPDGKDLVSTQDQVQDKNNSQAFAARAREKMSLDKDPNFKDRKILSVGKDKWPLPVPVVKREGKWYFDSKAGHDEILFRRIGANELNAIEVLRGFLEAQMTYASTSHDGKRMPQYAQKLISTPGKQDGLYWVNPDGTPGGPISEGVAKAIQSGYSLEPGSAYSGYYFRLLKGQGPAALPTGEIDYVIKGMMIGGFALIAVPAEYRVTGVQTFIINHEGIVYQKDLGPDTLNVAKQIEVFNPDETWKRTDD